MFAQTIIDVILLFGLGICAWQLFARLRLSAPEILGPVILIGALRISQIDLPPAPDFLFPAAQVVIGIFVGTMLDKNAIRQLRPMITSALVIITWTLSMIFLIGFFLQRFSVMNLQTAMLSASMGGLPEITILAVASGASAAVVIVMQLIRMLGTVMLFPVMLQWLENKGIVTEKGITENNEAGRNTTCEKQSDKNISNTICANQEASKANQSENNKFAYIRNKWNFTVICKSIKTFKTSWKKLLLTLTIASTGGLLLNYLGVPAGLMVGSTFAIAAASIAGLPISKISRSILSLLLVAVGINVSENITAETLHTMGNPDFLVPILIASAVMFASSFGVAFIITRITGWDYPTSFLAAAPGGFTVMTALAIRNELDPVKVSMLHLCRLLSIKMFLPLYFMTLI